MEKFTFFWQQRSPYSQWFLRDFIVDGVKFNCCEQYMMYMKAQLFSDPLTASAILLVTSPKEQKAYGRKVKSFDAKIWDANKMDIVYKGNQAKFTQNPDLLAQLLSTVDTTLVEASPYDKIWGIGLDASHPDAKDRTKWKGLNLLGQVLTKLRDDILAKN